MGSSCSSEESIDVIATTERPQSNHTTAEDDSASFSATTSRWPRRQQQLRDEARVAEILALQQSLAAMEDFFQSLLGHMYLENSAFDPQAGGLPGPPPAKATVLDELPRLQTTDSCGICGEPCGEAVQLPCGHLFHLNECVEPWLKRHCTCPVCRYELPTSDEDYETGRIERMSLRGIPVPDSSKELQVEKLLEQRIESEGEENRDCTKNGREECVLCSEQKEELPVPVSSSSSTEETAEEAC